jgi:hypothetical protein
MKYLMSFIAIFIVGYATCEIYISFNISNSKKANLFFVPGEIHIINKAYIADFFMQESLIDKIALISPRLKIEDDPNYKYKKQFIKITGAEKIEIIDDSEWIKEFLREK